MVDTKHDRYAGMGMNLRPLSVFREAASPRGYRWEDLRTNMTQLMSTGIEPARMFEDGLLLEGMRHHIFAGSEQGKTWLALWLAVQAIERGETVAYLDQENGAEIVSERLRALGLTDPEAFNHYEFLPMDTSRDAQDYYAEMLDCVQPTLIIFDSWAGFLSMCDFNEESNADIERWGNLYLMPPRQRHITTVMLDHPGHRSTNRARGAIRKRDVMDVQWKLSLSGRIDSGGTMTLDRGKNRLKGLPDKVRFAVGDSPDGFTFTRTDTDETATPSGTKREGVSGEGFQLMILNTKFGDNGATRSA